MPVIPRGDPVAASRESRSAGADSQVPLAALLLVRDTCRAALVPLAAPSLQGGWRTGRCAGGVESLSSPTAIPLRGALAAGPRDGAAAITAQPQAVQRASLEFPRNPAAVLLAVEARGQLRLAGSRRVAAPDGVCLSR